jgi:hypothetical protein
VHAGAVPCARVLPVADCLPTKGPRSCGHPTPWVLRAAPRPRVARASRGPFAGPFRSGHPRRGTRGEWIWGRAEARCIAGTRKLPHGTVVMTDYTLLMSSSSDSDSRDAEIFHCETSAIGGRLAWERQASTPAGETYGWMSQSARDLIRSAQSIVPSLPGIHFDFIHNPSVNAFAFKSDGRYFIGVTSGATYMLALVFSRMLSDRRLFASVGDPTRGLSEPPDLGGLVPDADHMVGLGVLPVAAPCPQRRRYASHLLDCALLFLVGHEIAHIALGHVDYLMTKSGSSLMAELGWHSDCQDLVLERQALEYDADRRSMGSRVASALLVSERAPPWSNLPIGETALLFDQAFAMNCLFRLFGDGSFSSKALSTSSYPPLPLRRLMASVHAEAVIAATWPRELLDGAFAAVRRAMFQSEVSFLAITGCERTGVALGGAAEANGMNHAETLANLIDGSLGTRLAPFAFENRADKPV